MRYLATALILWFPVMLSGQTLSVPDSVGNGEMIVMTVDDASEGDTVTFLLMQPDSDSVRQVVGLSGRDYYVDPPAGWSGNVRVLVTILNWDSRKFIQRQEVIRVGKADPDTDDPPPEDDDTDDSVGEYDGPNEFGLGQISFDNAPGYSADVVDIYKRAANYLKGIPSVKVMYTDDPNQNRTEYNVNVWIAAQMKQRANSAEWVAWYEPVRERIEQLAVRGQTTDQWHAALNEVAAGVEARK